MIQRVQTLYLAVAVLLCLACLSLPVGRFIDATGETIADMYNLWLHVPSSVGDSLQSTPEAGAMPVLAAEAEGHHIFTPWALFVLLVLITCGLIGSIFLYRTRLVQSRLVMLCAILLLGWYGVYAALAMLLTSQYEVEFQFTPWAAFPGLACILAYLAFRGILKDEALVRSLDRLR